MAENRQAENEGSGRDQSLKQARSIVRRCRRAMLASNDARSGGPYGSMIALATTFDGAPVTLISGLARHTKNILRDERVSILCPGSERPGEELLDEPRVSLLGVLRPSTEEEPRRRFLARHPFASQFADFGDFSFYVMQVDEAHLVSGFGAVRTMPGRDFLLDGDSAAALRDAESGAIEHMNADHADAIALYGRQAAEQAGEPFPADPSPCQITDIDPQGAGLRCGQWRGRIEFPQAVTSPEALRKALVALAAAARAGVSAE